MSHPEEIVVIPKAAKTKAQSVPTELIFANEAAQIHYEQMWFSNGYHCTFSNTCTLSGGRIKAKITRTKI